MPVTFVTWPSAAAYCARAGKRLLGLATDREPIVARAEDGSYVEIFEWASADAIEAAHSNAAVQELWERFGEACEYRTLASLSEAGELFAELEAVDL